MEVRRKLLIAGIATVPVLGAGGVAYAATTGASGQSGSSTISTAGTPDASTAADTAESSAPETAGELHGPEADGPGGHQDAPGTNVDHQFTGQE